MCAIVTAIGLSCLLEIGSCARRRYGKKSQKNLKIMRREENQKSIFRTLAARRKKLGRKCKERYAGHVQKTMMGNLLV